MARINFKTIAKNVDYTTFATYQEMLSYAGGSLSYPGQILGVLQAHDTPDNVTPFILDANKTPVGIASFSKVQEMIDDRIGNMAGALVLQGHAPSTEFNQALTNHTAGWVFVVITAGTYVGQQCNIGDMIICETTGTADNNDDWFVLESNQPNMVTSTSKSVDEDLPVFSGTSGKVIKNSGTNLSSILVSTPNYGLIHPPKGGTSSVQELSEGEISKIKQQLGVGGAASSAEKLATARTIWGQPFDGTNNVSGDMTGVGDISMTGSITNLTRLVTAAGDGSRRVKIDSDGLDLIPGTTGWVMGLNVRKQDLQERLAYIIGAYGNSAENIQRIFLGGTDHNTGLVTLMLNSGNLGIGTPNPTEKLDVNGNGIIRGTLTVSGGINGNASSATKLNNKRTIDGIDFDGTANINHQVVVSGAADDVAKTITKTGLTVKDGLELTAHFPNAHVKENMTLSINGGEAVPVLWPGGSLYGLPNNQVLDLVYRAGSFYVVGSRKRVVFNSISEFHEGFENGLITVGDYASINGSGGGIVEHIGDSASIKYFATMDWVEQQIAASNASIIARAIQALMMAFPADTQVSSNNIISVNVNDWSNIGTSVQNKVKQYIDTDNCIFHIALSTITNISALSDDEAVTLLINNVFDGARTIKFGTTNLTGRMVKGLFNTNPILPMRCFNDNQYVRLCGIDSIIYDGRIYYPTGDTVEFTEG